MTNTMEKTTQRKTVIEQLGELKGQTTIDEIKYPKQILRSDIVIKPGDFVTPNDDDSIAKVFLVKSVDYNKNTAEIAYLSLTEECDDVIIATKEVKLYEILYIGDSFVNSKGMLWNYREYSIFKKKFNIDERRID